VLCANAAPTNFFNAGVEAYQTADFARATEAFRAAIAAQPSAGALQNLGNAEWERRRTGDAVLAWEQSLWLDPFDANARNNLRFARETARLEAPELTWFEAVSSWLPVNWWGWLTAVSLWLALGLTLLPGILRRRKAPWEQAVAAVALGVLLLTLPAHLGTFTRARIGFVLQKNTALRLTPTTEAEAVTRLAAGDPVRKIRTRGNFIFVRTNHSAGWLENNEFGLIGGK
jgi:tetratricopeptide (TPR) repeat protein